MSVARTTLKSYKENNILTKDIDDMKNLIATPLELDAAFALADDSNIITATIPVSLDDMITDDLEGFLDNLEAKIVSGANFSNMSYKVVGVKDEYTVFFEVTAEIME